MLNVFAADHSDLEWMYRLFIHAANKGHFVFQNNKTGRDQVKLDFYSIVSQQKHARVNLRAQALVFENSQDKVGFIIMSEMDPKLGGNELYVFIVDEEKRGNGFGRHMLTEVIRRWHPLVDIYVRCLPASKRLASMLLKASFICQGKTLHGANIYVLEKVRSPQVAMG